MMLRLLCNNSIGPKWIPLILLTSHLCNCQLLLNKQNTLDTNKEQYAQISSKNLTTNQQNSATKSLDELLLDTVDSLELLDQRVSQIGNKTSNALMQDRLRILINETNDNDDDVEGYANEATRNLNDDIKRIKVLSVIQSSTNDKSNVSKDVQTKNSSNQQQVGFNDGQPIIDLNTNLNKYRLPDNQMSSSVGKRARQVSLVSSNEEQFVASDSTERHIKFTLELMQAVFETKGYNTMSNSVDSFLISPLSLQLVLMMMHLGSRGQTRRELNNCLHLTPSGQPISSSQLRRIADQPLFEQTSRSINVQKVKNNQKLFNLSQHQLQQHQQQQVQKMHELFGATIKDLLKDQNVNKSFSSANQIFLFKNLTLNQQYEAAIKHYYNADVKFVGIGNEETQSIHDSYHTNSSTSKPSHYHNHQQQKQQTTTDSKDAQKLINDWVEKQTHGHIQNILTSPLSESTLMIAINVLYFKGDWKYKFDTAETQEEALFTQVDGKTVKMPMMVNKIPLGFAYDPAMKTSVIELPYKAQRLGLFLMLPDEISGIFHTMKMLNATSFANLIASMRKPASASDINGGINIRIPRFKIESSPALSEILKEKFGLQTLLSPGTTDLSGMFSANHISPQTKQSSSPAFNQLSNSNNSVSSFHDSNNAIPQVGLNEVIQKAVLQVDEKGSVAVAATAVIYERAGIFNGNYFEADHPFLLFLMDKQTGLVLFSGVFAGNKE